MPIRRVIARRSGSDFLLTGNGGHHLSDNSMSTTLEGVPTLEFFRGICVSSWPGPLQVSFRAASTSLWFTLGLKFKMRCAGAVAFDANHLKLCLETRRWAPTTRILGPEPF